MANYKDKLKALNERYKKSKGAKKGGFSTLPTGTYQFEVVKATLITESKAKFAAGQLEFQVFGRVLTGEHKGTMGRISFFLEQPARGEFDSGLDLFKSFIVDMGVSMPNTSEKAILNAARELKGMKYVGYSNGKGSIYFNKPLDTPDTTVSDEDFDEDDEIEDEDSEDSDDDTEEQEETPKPQGKKKSKKSKSKVVEDEDEEDDEFDVDEFDED